MLIIISFLFYRFGISFPTSGLVSWYAFDGNCIDSKGSFSGTNHGATASPDRYGDATGALSFNGVDSWIEIGSESTLSPNEITVSMWINPRAGDESYPIRSWFHGFGLQLISLQEISAFVWADEGDDGIELSTTTAIDSGWQHVAFSYGDSEIFRLYVMGIEVYNEEGGEGRMRYRDGGTGFLTFGRDGESSQGYYDGMIDDVMIYNRELSSTDIYELYDTNTRVRRTCFDVLHEVDEIPSSGVYNLTSDWGEFPAYCVFEKTNWGTGFTLIESFTRDDCHNSAWDNDIPISSSSQPTFGDYRMSKAQFIHLFGEDQWLLGKCEYPESDFTPTFTQDYFIVEIDEVQPMVPDTYETWREFIHIDIRGFHGGNQGENRAPVFWGYGQNFHIDSYMAGFPESVGGGGEDNFGLFEEINTNHICTSSPQALTNFFTSRPMTQSLVDKIWEAGDPCVQTKTDCLCPTMTTENEGICVSDCPENCLVCDQNEKCSQCEKDWFLYHMKGTELIICVQTCPDGYTKDHASGQCSESNNVGAIVGIIIGLIFAIVIVVVLVIILILCWKPIRKIIDDLKKVRKLENVDVLIQEQQAQRSELKSAHFDHSTRTKLFSIPFEDVTLISEIWGGGGDSNVYKANWQGQDVAYLISYDF